VIGSGAPIASGLKEVSGVAHTPWILRFVENPRLMSTDNHSLETDQAAREASGGHPYGRYPRGVRGGRRLQALARQTVTESDDHLFCLITMNHTRCNLNDVYASQSQQGQNVVVGPLVYSLALV